mmetsp:Transcript_24953/g.61858  ORF Transcript_24953/g.61858 Transcript_24953/m.61858 type:complete len:145 (-) Transcript_24953:48-482(-)
MAPSRGTVNEGTVDGVRYTRAGTKNVHIFVPSAGSTGGFKRYTVRTARRDGTPRGLTEDLVRAELDELLLLGAATAAPAAELIVADAPVADSDSDAGQRQSKRSRKGEREAPFSPSRGWSSFERKRADDGRHVSTRDCSYEEPV